MKSQDVYTLCNASEAHRLSLIEELAGLKVYYDTRKKTELEIKVHVLMAMALMCHFFAVLNMSSCMVLQGQKEDMGKVSEELADMSQRLETLALEKEQVKE